MMNENERWQMYGLQAIERVNGKRMVWNEFAEAMRVLKLAVDRDLLEHLQQLEKDPDSTFVDSLMELHQNTENHELQCILNYLFHWRLEDPLESVAEAFFSCPPSYIQYDQIPLRYVQVTSVVDIVGNAFIELDSRHRPTSYPGSFHYAPRWRKDPGPGWPRVSQILGDNNWDLWGLGKANVAFEFKTIQYK